MRIVDCHVHCDLTSVAEAKAWLETSGVDAVHAMSKDPHGAADGGRTNIENLAEVARALPGRILPLAWIDPTHPDSPRIAEWAVRECGMLGYKMIPTCWYPDDPRAREVYRLAGELGVPIQFHSGILWLEGDTSKYNRPAGFEVMWEFPRVRFSLAHISWPWVDECVAVVQKYKVMNRRDSDRLPHQAMIDLTPGTPLMYRREALMKCINCVGVDFMMFGSDSGIPRSLLPEGKWQRDVDMLTELGCTAEDLEKVFSKNSQQFLAPLPPIHRVMCH